MGALFVGGLLAIITGVFSGLCLVMIDIDSSSLNTIGSSIGMDPSGFEMINPIIDGCLTKNGGSTSEGLFDYIKLEGGSRSIRSKIVNDTIQPVDAQFDNLQSASSDLTNGPGVQDLFKNLSNAGPFNDTESIDGSGVFRCDYFEKADGTKCNPEDILPDQVGQAGGAYTLDCVTSESGDTLSKIKHECSAVEFEDYVHSMSPGLNQSFFRLDKTAEASQVQISSGLKTAVSTYLTGPMLDVMDGGGCGFFADGYHGLLGGLCYGVVLGFGGISDAHAGAGWLSLFMILVIYGVWRVVLDNSTESTKIQPEV